MALAEVASLLASEYHEERLFALLLPVDRFRRGNAAEQAAVFHLYLAHTDRVNNWDLVDASAPYIVGPYLEARDKRLLYRFARSASLWGRRIAIMATFPLIRRQRFDVALRIAGMLVHDEHDLIHKAVGWMLREIGRRDLVAEKAFLNKQYTTMPRTMLRYAIEKFPPKDRKMYLEGVAWIGNRPGSSLPLASDGSIDWH